MCGIIGRVGDGNAFEPLLTGLENLEYRGYDSAGIAVQNGSGINVEKRSGKVDELRESIDDTPLEGSVGIGHTRWSTHGPPTDENAHPHTDETKDVAVVHNGIIENYAELKSELADYGHEFTSDTDTEVIPHLIQFYLDEGMDNETAFRRAIDELEGSYAVTAMLSGKDVLYAARQGSPLVVGMEDGEYFLASDVPAFLEYTDSVVYLEDGDVVIVDDDGVEFTDLDGNSIEREPETVEWDPEQAGKGEYDHFMLKEIHEQPTALSQALEGRIDTQNARIALADFEPGTFADVDSVQFVACGTSYHAALYGSLALKQAGIESTALLANEYSVSAPPVDDDTLVVAVTQSGETADTLNALRQAEAEGAMTVTVTNVVGSTAAREADEALFIRAGPEIGVAATKTFSSQAVMLTLLGQRIAADRHGEPSADLETLLPDLAAMPDAIDDLLAETDAEAIAERYHGSRSYFFIGRGLGFPVALEGALKFKEITYEHAEGFASGELKHGPLALVTPDTPVFAIFTGQEDEKTLKNAEEAQTRGAPVIAVCPEGHRAVDVADAHLEIPETDADLAGLLANVQLQLVSYYAADLLDRPIDKPRNLAKSVTVE
ncbi:glucosamine/fructose-6-phosphate aminotransferase, isomerizing (plasmid) [Haloterrigena turkmenica DSM 5511]|uniref:Glutamine--fructose-6-phosphate aminotransferase [isomerizing] n=1 Tax=Haloterrigena turkmenica (strain ATCC 51198 / DSM 5511 / JCM 9101 / NCIMB 13204 / VKM B-1734 / 4k) TaxID=543526 RepID=D2S2Z2_HALTV|nr:glutamine--fructose-6-phosphate transaminase (isomerizing) [Haloterrigena turkmenica]ADB63739.1 glucosamine/fructose-6-phosphate aminotransferase, isomerizing [Haloterrigena turkmenica DSM 5511]